MNTKRIINQLKAAVAIKGPTAIEDDTGVSRTEVWRIVNNKVVPKLDTFIRIADSVGLEVVLVPKK